MEDTRCLGRLTKWKTRLPFGDGKHYFTLEERCKRERVGEELCERCAERPTESKYQDKILHGLITEQIPVTSYIYGGPRYVEYLAKYGPPCSEAIEAAEHAHKLATEGYPEVPMAQEGRKKEKRGKGKEHPIEQKGNSEKEIVAANAVEISVRAQKIEVEHVKVYRRVVEGAIVMVDECGRMWNVDEKGVIVSYRGEWSAVTSGLASPLSPARSEA